MFEKGDAVAFGELTGKVTLIDKKSHFAVEAEFFVNGVPNVGYFDFKGNPKYIDLDDNKLIRIAKDKK